MNQKKSKTQPKQEKPWNSLAYLAKLAREKEPVIVHLNTNTVEDESELKGIIVQTDTFTLGFLTNDGRELLVFKHALRFVERLKKVQQ